MESAFQPEGVEDLAVFGDEGQLLEAVQVKDYSKPLVLNDFGPRNPNGFFARLMELRRDYPMLRVRLAHFGELGGELKAALEGNDLGRGQVVRKVARHGYATEMEVVGLLEVITAERVNEADLLARIDARLRGSVAGIDSSAALDLMTWWLYKASEQKLRVRQSDFIGRLTNVSRFIHERAAYHQEWYKTIEPLIDGVVVDERRQKLSDEFAQGISADYAHIQANVDIPRWAKLQAISDAFGQQSVVVLRGASGQGKSALAYRYLHDFVPENWRFRVRIIESRVHAMSIANALLGHASALHVPIVVLVDVSAQDDDWPELVRTLSRHPTVKVLVAIREEDWKRTQLYGYQLEFEDVYLEFEREEAEQIWDVIPSSSRFARFRGFADAWTRFGEGNLLLEFIHFVTEGTTLRERLREQINQREEKERLGNASPGELQLLRLVAIAAESESRVDTRAVVHQLNLHAAPRVISSFEREYLLRVSDSGEYLEGLHPVRSRILTDLLVDTATVGNSWHEAAASCLTLIDPNDVGGFLHHAAVRRSSEFEKLLTTLYSFRSLRWAAIAGVARTLIWQSIRVYVDANRVLLAEVMRDCGNGWSAILDTDLVEAIPGTAKSLFDVFESIVSRERMFQMRDFRNRQRPKEEAFLLLKLWFNQMDYRPDPPTTIEEWRAFGEVLFWAGRLGKALQVINLLPAGLLDEAARELPLAVVGDVITGVVEVDEDFAKSWLSENRDILVDRFRREERIIAFGDDGELATAHYILPPWLARIWDARSRTLSDTSNLVHSEALHRIDLMRQLFPDRASYACQGYGHLAPVLDLTKDDSIKTGIPRSRLPTRWGPQANGLFRGLVELSLRPADWQDYTSQGLAFREDTVKQFKNLCKGIEHYLASAKAIQVLNVEVSVNALHDLWRRSRMPPMLPKLAVDEWGYIDESRTQLSNAQAKSGGPKQLEQVPALETWRDLLSPLHDYAQAVHNFINGATQVLKYNETVAKREISLSKTLVDDSNEIVRNSRLRLSTNALSSLRMASEQLKGPFRSHLGDLVMLRYLEGIERQEEEIFERLWLLWRAYAEHPERILYRPTRTTKVSWDSFLALQSESLQRALDALSDHRLDAKLVSNKTWWDGAPSMCIVVDSEDAFASNGALELLLGSVQRVLIEVDDLEARDYAIAERWSQVVVVPVLKGRSLMGSGWRVPTYALLTADTTKGIERFNGIPHKMPVKLLEELNIQIWEEPRLELVSAFVTAAEEFLVLGVHLGELSNVPLPDPLAEELLHDHLANVHGWVAEAIKKLSVGLASARDITYSTQSGEAEGLYGDMASDLDAKLDLLKKLDIDGKGINIEHIAEWSEVLRTVSSPVAVMYLLTASEIVDQIQQ